MIAIDSKRIPFLIIQNEKNRTEIRQFIPQFISGFTLMEFWRVTAAWSAVWCRKNYERREWRELAWAPAIAAAAVYRRRRGASAASYELALTGLAVCGTAPRSSAAAYRRHRRLPARATTVYNNTKATELTQAGNGGAASRRRAACGGQLMKRPLTGRNHHIHILLAVSQSKMTWSFHEPSLHRKKMIKHNFDMMTFFLRNYVLT